MIRILDNTYGFVSEMLQINTKHLVSWLTSKFFDRNKHPFVRWFQWKHKSVIFHAEWKNQPLCFDISSSTDVAPTRGTKINSIYLYNAAR